MQGGTGDRRSGVDNPLDQVTELAGEGDDFVQASISYVLPEHVERGLLLGTGDLSLAGNGATTASTAVAGRTCWRAGAARTPCSGVTATTS